MKVIVRGGAPGFIRVELEDGSAAVDIGTDGNAYQTAHLLQPFMQVLADLVPPPPQRPSKAPKADT